MFHMEHFCDSQPLTSYGVTGWAVAIMLVEVLCP